MSERGNSRDRQQEPNEQQRAARRALGQCISCPNPSKTQRCADCRRRVEANTDRYAGQAQRGRPPTIDIDIRDVRFAMEELGKALTELMTIKMLGAMPPRKRDELIAVPMHRAHLARGFISEPLERSGLFPSRSSKAKATAKVAPPRVVILQLSFRFSEAR